MTIPPFVRKVLIATAFLSRLPVPAGTHDGFDGRIAPLSRLFPLAGFLIALPGAFLFALLLTFGCDALVAALVALAAQTLVTGALHEDGFADCADGFGGGQTKERVLEIMKDSRIGAYGAIALVLSFALRAAALAAIARNLSPTAAALLIPATAALARAMMVAHWQTLPSAREQGLAASAGRPDRETTSLALLWGTLLFGLPVLIVFGLPALFFGVLLAALAAFAMTRLAARRINGHTGDTIGAVEQASEIAILIALSLSV